ncbi:hypothetical protein PYCCODRAFT_1467410 [Trametes coccinea BRFM310]|uniref:Uncharacterized protein n=1 Tax=Trametes coccinea (strain BRFM310) TaxID=1353009 RepID=A0A1Y2ISD4_TRAC3|nr:hypothetical protein PYCCODRAFT_1467410 [Trametes coccinea BRFM310]
MPQDCPTFVLLLRDSQSVEETFRRRAEGFPDEDEDVVYTNRYRDLIVEYVNNAFSESVLGLFPRLPSLLAPAVGREFYTTTMSPAGMQLRVLFIWRELDTEERLRFCAKYAISFHIASQPPHAAVHLAHAISRFTYIAVRAHFNTGDQYDDDHLPQMKKFAYLLDSTSAYGIAFFDNIHHVYQRAVRRASKYPHFRASDLDGVIVSTWPPVDYGLLHEELVLRTLFKAAASVTRISKVMSSSGTRRQGKHKAAQQATSPSPPKRLRSTPSSSEKSSTTVSTEDEDIFPMRIREESAVSTVAQDSLSGVVATTPRGGPGDSGASVSTASRSALGAGSTSVSIASQRGSDAGGPTVSTASQGGDANYADTTYKVGPLRTTTQTTALAATESLSSSFAQSTITELSNADRTVADESGEEGNVNQAALSDLPDYIPEELIPRLERLVTFSEPAMNRYGIRCIPDDARWGTGKDGRTSQYDRFLCHAGKPLVVWMVGVVRYVHLNDSERFSIGISFLSEVDADAARRNLGARCAPPRDIEDTDSLTFIGRWVNSANRENEQTFNQVYDAVDRELRGWNPAARIPAARIQASDVVVVECYIKRFKNKSMSTGSRGWTAWGVQYELLRIAQLCIGPGYVDELPPDSFATI